MDHAVPRVRQKLVDSRAIARDVLFRGARARVGRALTAERTVSAAEGDHDSRGESGGGPDCECRADTPCAAAPRQVERKSRGRLDWRLAKLGGCSLDVLGPRRAVRANAKVRVDSVEIELAQLTIEVGRNRLPGEGAICP